MNQQPDNFFREKLEGFQKPASVGAWDRIESSLKKNNNTSGWWWKIAASLLLVAIAYWFQPGTETSKEQALAHSESEPPAPEIPTGKTLVPKVLNEIFKDQDSTFQLAAESKKILKKNKIPKLTIKPTPENKQNTLNTYDIKKDLNTLAQGNESVVPPVEDIHDPISKSKNITLKFSVEEANKYLDKNTLAQATSEEKKSSTFKKLLKKANDLKSNQNPFGELREKKNEILALNFKNEKRGQNK